MRSAIDVFFNVVGIGYDFAHSCRRAISRSVSVDPWQKIRRIVSPEYLYLAAVGWTAVFCVRRNCNFVVISSNVFVGYFSSAIVSRTHRKNSDDGGK